jgi:hypothetical protein
MLLLLEVAKTAPCFGVCECVCVCVERTCSLQCGGTLADPGPPPPLF